MILRSLKLTNFRNYDSFEVDFSPLTVFVGPNGSGKTNLIEAVYLLSIGKSYRTHNDQELIQWGKNFSKISGVIGEDRIEITISRFPNQEKIIQINSVKKKALELLSKLKIILFSAESLAIITGAPKERRKFLNLLLGQTDRYYLYHLMELQKVLRNRNSLLERIKEGKSQPIELDFWDKKLVELSVPIIQKRRKFIDFINQKISSFFQEISSSGKNLTVKYLDTVKNLDYFPNFLVQHQEREINHSVTLYGPHRDDFEITIDNRKVSTFASRGEIRSLIFTLKMTEWEYLKEKNSQPLLLLDDIFSELDRKRREKLGEIIKGQPTIITATEVDFLSSDLKKKAKIIELKNRETEKLKD